jgi:UDP-N-acetyl-2-amino-2-deoxyglucuronate dehydrogenase
LTTHIGIIGGGNISESHARAALELEGVVISAIYGQNKEKAERLSKLYGGRVYTDLNNFLDHKPLDIVLIGSPSGLHAEQGCAAARRGIHVLTEKPLDITTARADELINECERNKVKLGVFFQDRVSTDIAKLKELIDTGKVGNPFLASAQVRWYRPPEYYSNSRWRGTWALDGGGALINQGVHTVDLLLWLLGDVRKVYAKAKTALHKIEVEDTVVATLEFASGALGTLEATTAAYPGYSRRVEISGSEGTLVLEHDRLIKMDLRIPIEQSSDNSQFNTNESASSPIVSDVRGHRKIIEDFLNAIQTQRDPLCNGREGRRSIRLIEAIYESSKSGQIIPLLEDSKSF